MPGLSKTIHRRLAWPLINLGVAGLIAAGLIYSHQTGAPQAGSPNVSSAPSSTSPSDEAIANYSVPATDPKYIALPAIGINKARVIQLGLLGSGAIATPNNIYDTGWYNGSSKPGQPGAMFVYGHISSWQANGIFYNLKKLEPGDTVTVTRGDNHKFTYKVVGSKIYDYKKVDMKAALSPVNPGKPGLNLMTCTGQVIKGTSEFNERLVVFTSLVTS